MRSQKNKRRFENLEGLRRANWCAMQPFQMVHSFDGKIMRYRKKEKERERELNYKKKEIGREREKERDRGRDK